MDTKSEDYWKKKLTPQQYQVLREKGTEPPFSGEFVNHNEKGMYVCAACGAELFDSNSKYESSQRGLAGWPSFAEVVDSGAVELRDDKSGGMDRIEVICKKCGSHLGHVFDDESASTGKHYCINSCALTFEKKT